MSRFSNVKDQLIQILAKGKEACAAQFHSLKKSFLEKKKYSVKPVLLEFRCRGKLFYSVHSQNLSFPFKIGKAADNDLVLPADDRTSTDHVAVLENVKGKIVLNALPDQIFYVHGVTKTSYILPQEDRIAIGDCELFVSPAKKLKITPCDVHRLEFLNGIRKGQIIRLEKEHLTIGSNEKCDIQLSDSIVSGTHAEIKITPAEAWLKDSHSLNGTYVNDQRLGSQERVLMDSDKISIACFDFRFLDKNVVHTRSQIFRNFLIVGGTLAAVLLIFLLVYINIPYASRVALVVERLMKTENFSAAESLLKKMPESRKFKENEASYSNLQNRLNVYQATYSAWNSFKRCISEGNFSNAAVYIGQLDLSRETAWNWDSSTVRDRMALARESVQSWRDLKDLQAILYSGEILTDPSSLRTLYAEHSKKLNLKKNEKSPKWLLPLYKAIKETLAQLKKKYIQFERINAALNLLIDNKATFEQVKILLEKEQKDAGCLRYYMLKLQLVFEQLEVVQKTIDRNIEFLTNYEFNQIDFSLDFPDTENCILFPALQKKRDQLLSLHYKVLNAETTIRLAYMRDFKKYLTPERMKFCQDLNPESIITDDLFSSFFKKPYYEVMKGKKNLYNTTFGVRYCYNIIQQTLTLDKTGYDLNLISNEPNVLPIFKSGRALGELYALVSHSDGKFLLKNQFGKDMEKAAFITKKIAKMGKIANDLAEKNPGSRMYLIEKPIAFIINPSYISPKEIERYRKYWKQYRQKLQDLLDQYDPLDYKGSEKIREQIFAIAIPGDPLVSVVWNDVE